MSQRIVTECDECGAADASTYSVAALGQSIELDLCAMHVKPLAELVERFGELGRNTPVPTRARIACPYCKQTAASRDSLAKHVRRVHGIQPRELKAAPPAPEEEEALPYGCPNCLKTFATPQGLGAHRFRSHGLRQGD